MLVDDVFVGTEGSETFDAATHFLKQRFIRAKSSSGANAGFETD